MDVGCLFTSRTPRPIGHQTGVFVAKREKARPILDRPFAFGCGETFFRPHSCQQKKSPAMIVFAPTFRLNKPRANVRSNLKQQSLFIEGESHETTQSNHKPHHSNYRCDRAGMRIRFVTTCQRTNWRREPNVRVLHISELYLTLVPFRNEWIEKLT